MPETIDNTPYETAANVIAMEFRALVRQEFPGLPVPRFELLMQASRASRTATDFVAVLMDNLLRLTDNRSQCEHLLERLKLRLQSVEGNEP